MAAQPSTVERNLQLLTTSPGIIPGRLAGGLFRFSASFPKVNSYLTTLSTSATHTANFGAVKTARMVGVLSDTKVNIRMNGLGAFALGTSSNMATARLFWNEGSTTSLVVSNLSSAFIGNLEVFLCGS